MQMNEIPSIGTTLTYGEAIKAYDRFERSMLEKVYRAELLPAVGLHDLLWQLESLAQKFGIVELADHLVGASKHHKYVRFAFVHSIHHKIVRCGEISRIAHNYVRCYHLNSVFDALGGTRYVRTKHVWWKE